MPRAIAPSALAAAAFACAAGVWAQDKEIRFARGATSATIEGDWQGRTDTYVFRARQGQRLVLRLNDGRVRSGHLDLTLYSYCGEEYGTPIASNVARVDTTLPCNGKYSLDVAARTDIAIKQDQENYRLSVSIR
jgi:hypothetical protein